MTQFAPLETLPVNIMVSSEERHMLNAVKRWVDWSEWAAKYNRNSLYFI
ncbi:MAG: hypothetical protein PVF58_05550 [Candidatus Methanofastidiosia archaeon]|jgi:hypothetical protein